MPALNVDEAKLDASNLSKFRERVKDPVALGLAINQLMDERRRMNLALSRINDRLDRLERIFESKDKFGVQNPPSTAPSESRPFILAPQDRDILGFVKEKGAATAEDVRVLMNYKGRNAASTRLNSLVKDGILEKKQVGREVFFSVSARANLS